MVEFSGQKPADPNQKSAEVVGGQIVSNGGFMIKFKRAGDRSCWLVGL